MKVQKNIQLLYQIITLLYLNKISFNYQPVNIYMIYLLSILYFY